MTIVELRDGYHEISSKNPNRRHRLPSSTYSSSASPLAPPGENAAVVAFFLLGVGVLLPWNALISALDFYATLFPTLSVAQFITNAYTFPFMVAGILLALSPRPSRHRRPVILYGFILLTLLPAVLPMLTARDEAFARSANALQSRELWLTVATAAVIGVVGAMLQSTLFATITLLPGGRCTTAFSAGGGVASVFIVLLRVFCRAFVGEGAQTASLKALRPGFNVFLLAWSALSGLCIAVFLWLDRCSAYYAYHVPGLYGVENEGGGNDYEGAWENAKEALGDIMTPAVCLFSSFVITLSLFPGIMVQVPVSLRGSVSTALTSWYPLLVIAFFAAGDTVGRSLPTEGFVEKWPLALPALSALRASLVPLYLVQWSGFMVVSQVGVVVMTVGLGIANGLVVTMAFLSVPGLAGLRLREVAGRLMFVTLISGISVGNGVGWAVEAAMRYTSEF